MIASIANHLWQTTLVTLGIGLLCLLLGNSGAKIRYRLWLAASLKFLVPFAPLVTLGTYISSHTGFPQVSPATLQQAVVIERIVAPMPVSPPPPRAEPARPDVRTENKVPIILAAGWALGALWMILRWRRRWHPVQRALHASKQVDIPFPVPVRSTKALLEPGVVGFLRPVILLPEGIEARLTPEQLRAVLAHELCHVKRRDNLTAAFHMAVEIVFWFYPVVWWLGSRLIAERERACDEEVLRSGHAPQVYAEGILNACKHYLQAPPACAASVGGASLKERIETIMKNRSINETSRTTRLLVAMTGFAALAAPTAWGILSTSVARAQSSIDATEVSGTLASQLRVAAAAGQLTHVRALLAQGADVNSQDAGFGDTALTHAARNGHAEVVNTLLANGAKVDLPRREGGWTALMLAAGGGHGRVAQALVEAGADVNHQGGAGFTALLMAASSGSDVIVQLLLDKHAVIDRQNALGETALLAAALAGHAEVVGLLLDHGADIHHKRGPGETALDLAAQRRHVAVVRVLLARGGAG